MTDLICVTTSPWTYKAPSRVVYNASRLEGWYADLANPSVPLSKLAKNIPSAPSSSVQSGTSTGTGTYTGSTSTSGPVPSASKLTGTAMDKNLDMLINRQVPLYRALWFLQAVGQNDIAQLGKSKNLQVHPILSYSADYTVSFVEALKRQVGEALLPITQTTGTGRLLPGMSVKGRPRNILAEEQGRDRWLAKLNYTLELLSASLDEGMLDRQRLCSLLIQQLQPQTRIQMLWWLSVIIQTTIDDMLATAWMSKALVIVLFEWLQSMAETSPQTDSDTATCEDVARSLMRHIWLTDSDMFLIPHLWSKKSVADQLKSALGIGYGNASDEDLSLWSNLEERAYILLCKRPPRKEVYSSLLVDLPSAPVNAEDSMASQHWTVDSSKVVRLLDEWTDSDSIESITEKLVEASSSRSLPHEIQEPSTVGDSSETWSTGLHPEVIKLLLMWATTTTRCGNHRPYLVTSILGQCLGLPRFSVPAASTTSNATLDDTPSIDIDRFEGLQDCIMQWIDCQEKYLSGKARASSLLEWTSREATLWMCYSLLSSRILDISGLVQKVIARGAADTGNTHGDGIYVQILKDYGGNSNRVALKWQMGRVSISHRNADDGEALESIQARILENLQPFLQQLQTQNDGHQVNLEPLGLENFKARLSTLPVIKRAWILNAWLAPIVDEVTQANQK